MENIKESIKILLSTAQHRKNIEEFARSKFNENSEIKTIHLDSWKSFEGFDILSETSIRVKYSYGGGNMEFNDSFILNL